MEEGTKKKFNLKDALKLLFVLGVIIALSFLFPAKKNSVHVQKQGEIWKGADLYAPYDLPVRKSKEQISKEKAKLSSSIPAVYTKSNASEGIMLESLLTELGQVIPEVESYKDFMAGKLADEFIKGIVSKKERSLKFELLLDSGTRTVDASSMYDVNEFSSLLKEELMKIGVSEGTINSADLQNIIKPTYNYNDSEHKKRIESAVAKWPLNDGVVKKDEKIVSKGELIDEYTYRKLMSLEEKNGQGAKGIDNYWVVFAGYLLLTCLIIGVLMFYLARYFPQIDDNLGSLVFILMWPLLFGFLVFAIEENSSLSTYLIPFCIAPIVIKNFYGERLALFVHVVVVLIASFLSSLGYEFTFLQIFAGIVAVLIFSDTRYWNKFFIAIVIILAAYVLAYLGLSLIKEGSFATVQWKTFMWLALNAVLLLLAYPFIPLLEKIFGFTSSVSLRELSDMNRPLLKELSIKAPGTLQHSLQVANLAEAATEKIGGNSLLVKTAALYHDIGKMKQPEFYIENSGGKNMHAELNNNFESAKIIIDHIVEGEKMAKKAKLPQVIIDFITTHHGTTRVEYFYRNQKNAEPDREFDESLFRYPGPKPKTKEQTILMIADSLEAASKSLKSPTGQDIDELVSKIVNYKISQGQLDDSELSFAELEECMTVFKSLLRSINHVRIEYPDEVK